VPVDLETDTYFEFQASRAFEQWEDTTEEDGIVPEVKHKKVPKTYAVEDHALREAVNVKAQEKSARVGFNELSDVTESLRSDLALNHEVRAATLLTTSGNHLAGHVLTAGAGSSPGKWDDQTNGHPYKDLMTVLDLLLGKGRGEVRICFSHTAWRNFSLHTKVLAAFQPTRMTSVLAPQDAEESLRSQGYPIRILVAGGWKHTGAHQAAEDSLSLSRIWGDNVVFNVAPRGGPGIRKPAGAYTFRQRVKGQTLAVYTYLQQEKGGHGSTWVQLACDDVTKITGKQMLGLITATST
jgi:hypothetical protein